MARTPAAKQKLAGLLTRSLDIVVDGLPGWLDQLKPNRSSPLLLASGGPIDGVAVRRNIIDLQATTSQPRSLLSIARLNNARSRTCWSIWSFVRIAQTCFGLSGGFAPVSLPLFQGIPFVVVDWVSLVNSPLLPRRAPCAGRADVGFYGRYQGVKRTRRVRARPTRLTLAV